MDNKRLMKNIEKSGLYDVVLEWLKNEKYVTVSKIMNSFSISYNPAKTIFDNLMKDGVIETIATYSKGYHVKSFGTGMKIYLLSDNSKITEQWSSAFKDCEEIEIVNDNFNHFMNTHDVECVVSPANSFGDMSGGYDLAIIDYFGKKLEEKVQEYINNNYYREQPVGSSFIIDIPNTSKKLIHTPTMRKPSLIIDDFVIYQCFRSAMMVAMENSIKSIVLPAFGGSCGGVKPYTVAWRMKGAYIQIVDSLK